MFADLKSQSLSLDVTSTQANLLKKFFDYVEKQWITNPIWPTTKWWWLGLLCKLFELYTNNNIYVIDADVDDEKEDEE